MHVQSADGTKIAYDLVGSGPLLVMITGATCFRKFSPIKKDAKVIGKRFKVINYDRRGRGDSGSTNDWSLQHEIEDIKALIDANGGSAYIYGHSSGAVIALEAALQLGDRITGCAIFDISNVADEVEAREYQKLKGEIQTLLDRGSNGKAIRHFLIGIGMPRFFALLLPLVPEWKTMKALAPTLMFDISLTENIFDVERYKTIGVPVYAMAGAKNPQSIIKNHQRLTKELKQANGPLISNESHMVNSTTVKDNLVKAWLS